MSHRIARFFEPLLRLLLPSSGRHRLVPVVAEPAPITSSAAGPAVHRGASAPLRGEDNALVRPYLVAHERRCEARRRRVLWLAVHGVDLGSRLIHGVGAAR